MKRDLAVCLVSGGMDSCVCASIARKDYRLAFLHFSYGQRTEKRELRAFRELSEYFKVKEKFRLDVKLDFFKKIGGSSLIDKQLKIGSPEGRKRGNIPDTYVPFRNAIFLSIATAWAEVIGAKRIFIGAVEQDSSAYPDCRATFYKKFNTTIKLGTKPGTEIKVITPLVKLKKHEIVKLGKKLNSPFHITWSCYRDNTVACGVCESCRLRVNAFQRAGVKDPIKYKRVRS